MTVLASRLSPRATAPFAAIALLALVAGAPAAHAYAPTKACSGAFCAESFRIVEGGSHAIRFSFRGSAINHYNVRFIEKGGREVQRGLGTFSNSNLSNSWRVRSTNGARVTFAVQACNSPLIGKSKCTPWTRINLTLS